MIEKKHFGTMPNGEAVSAYRLINANNVSVNVLTLGGIIQSWEIPGEPAVDIVLGFDTVEDYLNDVSYIGTAVGRYANRIANGTFTLGQHRFTLSKNLADNTLHGGRDGFHHRLWHIDATAEGMNPSIRLKLFSADGDQGFPGNLEASVEYQLTEDNCLCITYTAVSDKDTVFNPTQHSYFNLGGHGSGQTLHNQIQLNASHYTPADSASIPTGDLQPVIGTAFDLTKVTKIADVIASNDPEIAAANGLDHNWCLDDYLDDQQNHRVVAILSDPDSGRALAVKTSMPGMQVYTGNFIGEGTKGKQGATYGPHHAVCLETQYYPDTPNKPNFPSATLKKGERFVSRTDYQLTF